tara:strand:+ start:428 stop:547 length:120 start_codon:yes stop_codon:yes gene_type:complete
MSDIEIKNGKNPKYISIDLDPKEWFLILITVIVAIYLLR